MRSFQGQMRIDRGNAPGFHWNESSFVIQEEMEMYNIYFKYLNHKPGMLPKFPLDRIVILRICSQS